MLIIPLLLKEFEQEANITRTMLQKVPNDKFDWQPHEKSMTMMQLTTHLVELPGWIAMALTTSELDFAAAPYEPKTVTSANDLLALFEEAFAGSKAVLSGAAEDDLLPNWTLRSGDHIHMVMSKYEVIRFSLSQTIHHRAQLGVYLRLLNIALPRTYGPSADDQSF